VRDHLIGDPAGISTNTSRVEIDASVEAADNGGWCGLWGCCARRTSRGLLLSTAE
jgi:hypothetical protein